MRLDSTQSIHYSQHRRKKWVRRADVVDSPNEKRPWYQRFLPAIFFPKQAEDGDEMICVNADPESSPLAMGRHSSSFFMYAATIAMFGGPHVHADRLREIALDQIVNKKLLAKYTEKMVAEWRDVALYVGSSLCAREKQSADLVIRSREPCSLAPMYRSWPSRVLTERRRVTIPRHQLNEQAISRS